MENEVWEALQAMRPPFVPYEIDLHRLVEQRLTEAGLPFAHEAKIGAGCRIDYLVGDVGIEIKKGKPAPDPLKRQLLRYAACEGRLTDGKRGVGSLASHAAPLCSL